MYNICLQNVVQYKYKVAENPNTQVKYLNVVYLSKSHLVPVCSITILNFDTNLIFSANVHLFKINHP